MRRTAGAVLLAALTLGGCYSIGYVPDPALGPGLLAVPIFENRTLRRHLEHQLTRDVRREVLETTPLHLARAEPGVPLLRGSIVRLVEGPIVVDGRSQLIVSSVRVTVVFGVYAGERLLVGVDVDGDGDPDLPHEVVGYAEFATPRGETVETATDEALRDVAEMIALRLQAREDDHLEDNDTPEQAAFLAPGVQSALIQRDAEWFSAQVPPRHALAVTLLGEAPGLRLRGARRQAPGADAADAVLDGGRGVWFLGGSQPSEVLIEVVGEDRGAHYQLLVEAPSDDWLEPNDRPGEATLLEPGRPLRLLQRDEDWFRIEVPAGRSLRVAIEAEGGEVDLVLTDADGLPLRGAEQQGPRAARLAAAAEPRSVRARVSGDGAGARYRIEAALE